MASRSTLGLIVSLSFLWYKILTLEPLDYVWGRYSYLLASKYVTFGKRLSNHLRVARSYVWELKPSQEASECGTFACPWSSKHQYYHVRHLEAHLTIVIWHLCCRVVQKNLLLLVTSLFEGFTNGVEWSEVSFEERIKYKCVMMVFYF